MNCAVLFSSLPLSLRTEGFRFPLRVLLISKTKARHARALLIPVFKFYLILNVVQRFALNYYTTNTGRHPSPVFSSVSHPAACANSLSPTHTHTKHGTQVKELGRRTGAGEVVGMYFLSVVRDLMCSMLTAGGAGPKAGYIYTKHTVAYCCM